MNISIQVHLNKNNIKVISINKKEDLDSDFFLKNTEKEDIYIIQKGDMSITFIKTLEDMLQNSSKDLLKTTATQLGGSQIQNINIMKSFFFLEDLHKDCDHPL